DDRLALLLPRLLVVLRAPVVRRVARQPDDDPTDAGGLVERGLGGAAAVAPRRPVVEIDDVAGELLGRALQHVEPLAVVSLLDALAEARRAVLHRPGPALGEAPLPLGAGGGLARALGLVHGLAQLLD